MNILIVSATEFEILPLLDFLKERFKNKDNSRFFSNKLDIRILITGVGAVHTSFYLATFLAKTPTDLAINLGIAGAFDKKTPLGKVFQITSDRFADIGVEEASGAFSDIFDMELCAANEPPYQNAQLLVDAQGDFLPTASAITVNKVQGTAVSIAAIQSKYLADTESMEGAAFFYCCQMQAVNCLQIRSISNHIEVRNKDNWNIPLAINNLNQVAIDMIKTLGEMQ